MLDQFHELQAVDHGDFQDAHAILYASGEVDGGGFFKIFGGTGDFRNLIT